jgi:hypothetical protein
LFAIAVQAKLGADALHQTRAQLADQLFRADGVCTMRTGQGA